MILLPKYLGQLFWWFFSKKQAATKEKSEDIQPQDVTLTIITVTTPRVVISFLDNVKESIQFVKLDNGHYRWNVMAIEVHLLVVNELRVARENYGWLAFAEGRKYSEYQEKLAEGIAQDRETHQTYFELLTQLEDEVKERMASDVMHKYLSKIPMEKRVQFIKELISPNEVLQKTLSELPPEKLQKIRKIVLQLTPKNN